VSALHRACTHAHDLYGARRSQGVEFLAISSEGSMADKAEIQAFLSQNPAPYPNLLDDREVGGLYRVVSLPHLVIIGAMESFARVMVGQEAAAEIDAAIQQPWTTDAPCLCWRASGTKIVWCDSGDMWRLKPLVLASALAGATWATRASVHFFSRTRTGHQRGRRAIAEGRIRKFPLRLCRVASCRDRPTLPS